jgi:hypothetical protein
MVVSLSTQAVSAARDTMAKNRFITGVQIGTPDAYYAILERSPLGWSVTFRYAPYDHMSMAELAGTNGMPAWASALGTGWVE